MDESTPSSEQAPRMRPFEEIAKELGLPAWQIASAKAVGGWAIGREVTDAEFQETLDRALNAQSR